MRSGTMYCLFAIVFLFHLASGHFWGHHDHDCDHGHWGSHRHPWHRHHHHQHEDYDFDRLARCVISADKQLQSSCQQSPYSRTKVLQGQDFYALKYSLQEFTENEITVKFQHRVIYVTADSPNAETFKDLRIVPDFVKIADASWYFENGILTVLMPYKNPLKTEVALTCGDINESVVEVAKVNNSPDDLRYLGTVVDNVF